MIRRIDLLDRNTCYNDENVEALLASLRLSGEGWEMIVVDACSPKVSPTLLERLSARLIRLEHQSGPEAANLSVRDANRDVIVFCDADIVLAGEALAHVRRYFEVRGEAVIASRLLPDVDVLV
jgi:glycosyltransferase involved in cell wall biosynthesis